MAKGAEYQRSIIANAATSRVTVEATDSPVARKVERIGFLEGQFEVPDGFDTMFQGEIIRMFEGEE